ncbi:TPA: hypothetical protein ACUNCG_000529 [Aeromonas hydrophila]
MQYTSLYVSQKTNRRHDQVLSKIKSVLDSSDEYTANLSSYVNDKNHVYPMYEFDKELYNHLLKQYNKKKQTRTSAFEYVGKSFYFLDGIIRSIVSASMVAKGKTSVSVYCHVCAEDTEMYGDSKFDTNMTRVKRGAVPCGCSEHYKPTTEQAILRIKRYLNGEKYSFVELEHGDYKGSRDMVVVNCPEHGNYTTRYDQISCGVRCPQCAKTGYDINKPGTLYIVEWINESGDRWFKFGITNKNNDDTRIISQRNRHKRVTGETLSYDVRFRCWWEDGRIAYELEKEISRLQEIHGNPCNRETMDDGHNECLPVSAYEDLQEIVKGTIWVDVDLINDHYVYQP